MSNLHTEAIEPAEILASSPLPQLQRLIVTVGEQEVVITGRVPSFYFKQLAQETIKPSIGPRRLLNRIEVISTTCDPSMPSKGSVIVPDRGDIAIRSQEAPVLWNSLIPGSRGFVKLVDDMLLRCHELKVRLTWHGDVIAEYPLVGGTSKTFNVKLHNSVWRALLARLCKLCNDTREEKLSPYGGSGSFIDPRWPHVRFDVDFNNTPAEQHLDLTPVFSLEPS